MERGVGTCATCGGDVTLRLSGWAREARCGCGASVIPAPFFAANEALARGPAVPMAPVPPVECEELRMPRAEGAIPTDSDGRYPIPSPVVP